MDQKSYFDFCTERAQRLADYWAIHADIYESLQYIYSYRALNDSDSPDFLARKALSNAALLCYARSFVTGVRTRISEEATRTFTTAELRHHLDLMEIRNKWIAHSVNDFETHQVKLEVACLPSGEMVPKKLLCGVQHPISLSGEEIGALEGLAEKVLAIAMDLLHQEEMLVLSSISAEDLAGLKVDPAAFKCKESSRHPSARRKFFQG
jgi:hypothetical protein